ncbi:sensor histidine kinase [Streptomyces sp. NPDC090075]|uniref:sensor histidine kinase n=1 Tax=Streptomyces sp. NPDC090075 TaxID=3365937 RepID=UPI00381D8156
MIGTKSVPSHGCLRGFGVGVLVAAAVVDALDTGAAGHSVWPVALVLLTGLTAVLWPAARRPPWLTPELGTAVPGALSALLTVGSLVSGARYLFGPGEAMVLLCLLFIAVRHRSPRWVVARGPLDAVALLATPVRYAGSLSDDNAPAFIAIGLVLVGLTAGLASYLRSLDYRRAVAVGETRRAERPAIAADLHDFVAHHVTGILVQTQVARMMAATGSGEPDPVPAGIERAATEALASMRRTVGVPRDTGPEPDRRPVGDLAAITELTDGFPASGQKVTRDRAPGLDTEVPHEVQAARFRVVPSRRDRGCDSRAFNAWDTRGNREPLSMFLDPIKRRFHPFSGSVPEEAPCRTTHLDRPRPPPYRSRRSPRRTSRAGRCSAAQACSGWASGSGCPPCSPPAAPPPTTRTAATRAAARSPWPSTPPAPSTTRPSTRPWATGWPWTASAAA